ncbi:MAG: hypothetical protein QG614_411 [Patescibacteria group bacterium]|nr:hypothetical protein [Patescibacteria group bacterium]
MKKVFLFCIVIMVISIFFYTKTHIRSKNSNNEQDTNLTACSKAPSQQSFQKLVNSYTISSNYKIVTFVDTDNNNTSGREYVYRFDYCSGKSELLYTRDHNDYHPVDAGMHFSTFVYGKYLIKIDEPQNKILYLDLSTDKLNIDEPWKQNYNEKELPLSDNETVTYYEIPCGDGCDIDTQVLNIFLSKNKISLSVFDKTIKEKKVINKSEIEVNKKLREAELILP